MKVVRAPASEIGGGPFQPHGAGYYVRFSGGGGGGGGLGKPLGGSEKLEYVIGQDSLRENAMATLDDLFGFGVVPPTYIRATDIPAGELYKDYNMTPRRTRKVAQPLYSSAKLAVSVQEAVRGAVPIADAYNAEYGNYLSWEGGGQPINETVKRNVLALVDRSDLEKIAVLDYIGLNEDRHAFNIVVTPSGRARAIDHELTFEADNTALDKSFPAHNIRSLPLKVLQGEDVPESLHRALNDISEGDFRAALAGIDRRVIERAVHRLRSAQGWSKFPAYMGW